MLPLLQEAEDNNRGLWTEKGELQNSQPVSLEIMEGQLKSSD